MARKQSETMKKLASFESAMSIVRVKLRSDGMPVHVSSNGSGCLVIEHHPSPNVPCHRMPVRVSSNDKFLLSGERLQCPDGGPRLIDARREDGDCSSCGFSHLNPGVCRTSSPLRQAWRDRDGITHLVEARDEHEHDERANLLDRLELVDHLEAEATWRLRVRRLHH